MYLNLHKFLFNILNKDPGIKERMFLDREFLKFWKRWLTKKQISKSKRRNQQWWQRWLLCHPRQDSCRKDTFISSELSIFSGCRLIIGIEGRTIRWCGYLEIKCFGKLLIKSNSLEIESFNNFDPKSLILTNLSFLRNERNSNF